MFMNYLVLHRIFVLLTALPVLSAFAMVNPASYFCTFLGYELDESSCVFPDGSSCEQWSFWRGECGADFHLCTLRGGTLVTDKSQPICRIQGKDFIWTYRENPSSHTSRIKLLPITKPIKSLEGPVSPMGNLHDQNVQK